MTLRFWSNLQLESLQNRTGASKAQYGQLVNIQWAVPENHCYQIIFIFTLVTFSGQPTKAWNQQLCSAGFFNLSSRRSFRSFPLLWALTAFPQNPARQTPPGTSTSGREERAVLGGFQSQSKLCLCHWPPPHIFAFVHSRQRLSNISLQTYF